MKNKRSLGAEPFLYPLPVLLVGTYDGQGKPNLMNAAWGGICGSEPVSLYVSIRPSRHTHDALLARKAFTVGIANTALAQAADYLGMASGKNADKFAVAGLTPIRAQKVDAPYAAECPVVLECALSKTVELGSHTMMIGAILDVKIDEDCLDENNAPVLAKIDPLIYDMGAKNYHQAGGMVAKAFNAGRALLPMK